MRSTNNLEPYIDILVVTQRRLRVLSGVMMIWNKA